MTKQEAIQVTTQPQGIAAALAKAQTQMGPALKQSNNPAFRSKYADLGNVIEACLPALNSNGIAVIQPIGEDEVGRFVKTVLVHSSGETLECRVPLIIGKNDMQGFGSAVTYARRYGLMAMAGIAPEDDDGNAAAKAAPRQEPREEVVSTPATAAADGIREAWKNAVLDSLPENATEAQKAEAFADAIIADFKGKGAKALDNAWNRHERIIQSLEQRYPALFGSVSAAYNAEQDRIANDSEPSRRFD
jgi:hypothetical protein